MARPPRQYTGSLSPGQASYVLERLIAERKISANDIERYVAEMSSEISTLEARLQKLRDAAGPAVAAAIGVVAGAAAAAVRGRKRGRPGRKPGRPARAAAEAPAAAAGTKRRGRKRAAITSEQRASRQLQGRYLALVRQFAPARRAAFAKIAKEKGREAAIKEMQDARK